MKQVYRIVILLLASVLIHASIVHAADPLGFVVFSKGDAYNRTMTKKEFFDDKTFGAEQTICARGAHGGDIQGQISFDGNWVAFSRSLTGTGGGYGGNDYHSFDCWDLYIVRIDGALPATPIRVDHGYWASWGEDSYGDTKTLYYSIYGGSNGSIKKVTIGADGSLSNGGVHIQGGVHQFAMSSPDGNFVAMAMGNSPVYASYRKGPLAGTNYTVGDGCHPHVTADNMWVFSAINRVGYARANGSVSGGLGDYHFGSSQDMKWIVSRTNGNWTVQNNGLTCWIWTMNTDGMTIGNFGSHRAQWAQFTGDGSWVDIHAYTNVQISSFTADKSELIEGGSATLSWNTISATTVTLDGDAVDLSGSLAVTPSVTTTYTLRAVGEGDPVEKQVEITVGPEALVSIGVSPTTVSMFMGETVELTAEPKNQEGEAYAGAEVSWTVAGSGSLSSATGTTVTYTAGNEADWEVTVTASSGDMQAEVAITVNDPDAIRIRVNCGGGAVGEWESDAAYASGGASFDFGSVDFDLSGVTDPAPQGVYRAVRHNADHTYTFPTDKVPDGTYLVRLHFADTYENLRNMTYIIEGGQVLSNFSITETAGGPNKAVVKEFTVNVSDGDGMLIEAKKGSSESDIFESGIEIISGPDIETRFITVDASHTGAKYCVDQTVEIKWTASGDVSAAGVTLAVSPDGGRTWLAILKNAIDEGDEGWGAYSWSIPAELEGTDGPVSLVSTTVKFQITEYGTGDPSSTSGEFEIGASGQCDVTNLYGAQNRGGASLLVRRIGERELEFVIRQKVGHRVDILSTNGMLVKSFAGVGQGRYRWDAACSGMYLVRVTIGARKMIQRVTILR